jgi:tetratricopeptide (TPR) repeat protein
MKLRALLAAVLALPSCEASTHAIECTPGTTSSAIAIANMDQLIFQLGNDAGVEELLLVRSQFLGDYDALDRASSLGESRFATSRDLLLRARTRSAVHRFADALADLAAAERAGAKPEEVAPSRASILVAIGRAADAIPLLEAGLVRNPGFASRSALAGAYAAVGRLADADRLYVEALGDLDTTLPFPYAWIYFARGLMWVEQGRDPVHGEALYKQALTYLPEFVAANMHLAELEIARADSQSAMPRLERVVQLSNEPEAAALLGMLYIRTGNTVRGSYEIEFARRRYDSLLVRCPFAFADHASEFYLGPGADPERAWVLAQQNLVNRQTGRAAALAIKAAEASGRRHEARALLETYPNLTRAK